MADSSSSPGIGAAGFGAEYLDWKHWAPESFGRFSADEAAYFAAETGLERGAGQRVLEVGFGNGALLGWLAAAGAEVYGVEANPRLVAEAARQLGAGRAFANLAAPPLQRLAGTFSHVIAVDVLEHVPQQELGTLLGEMAALLAPAGRIIARFPNGDSPFGRIHQHGDPTHVTTIGRAKLEYFARRAGLSLLALRAPALPRRGVRWSRRLRRGVLLATRFVFERLIGLLYFGGRHVPLDPNYVAVLVKRAAADEPPAE